MGKIIAIALISISLLFDSVHDTQKNPPLKPVMKNVVTVKKPLPNILSLRINMYEKIKKYNPNLSREQIYQIIVSVYKYSKKYKLPEDIIYAIIAAESEFRPGLKGDDVGLMQIREVYASGWARAIKMKYKGPETLLNIDDNICLGTYILSFLMKKYNEDLEKVLVAYNWGSGNVDRVVKAGKELPQAYVKLITKHYYRLFQEELAFN